MQDATDVKTDIANEDGVGKLTFSGSSGEIKYDLSLPLLKEIDVQASQVSVTPRNIFLIIAKVSSGGAVACVPCMSSWIE